MHIAMRIISLYIVPLIVSNVVSAKLLKVMFINGYSKFRVFAYTGPKVKFPLLE